MSDEIPSVPVIPGSQTSEYKAAQSTSAWSKIGLVLGIIVALGPQIMGVLPENSKWYILGGSLIALASQVQNTLVSLGYIKGRSDVKAAASLGQKK